MRLSIITFSILPTQKAHGFQIAKTCETLADEGVEVDLILPRQHMKGGRDADLYNYYGVKSNFSVKEVKWINVNGNSFIKYSSFLLKLLFLKIEKESYIFTRHPAVVFLFSRLGYKVIYETHNWTEQDKGKRLFFLKKVFIIITTTKIIRNEYIKNGISPDKIVAIPHGVDLKNLKLKNNKKEIRTLLGIPLNKKIIVYSGHLYGRKGVDTIAEAAQYLSDEYLIVFVGGLKKDINRIRNKIQNYTNVMIAGHKSPAKVPLYLAAADFLVIANSKKNKIERLYTAPLKLFEYLSVNQIIVASDVPAIKEFLDENTAVLFESDNSKKLAQAIEVISSDGNRQKILLNNSLKLAKKFSWQRRSRKIIDFIKYRGTETANVC